MTQTPLLTGSIFCHTASTDAVLNDTDIDVLYQVHAIKAGSKFLAEHNQLFNYDILEAPKEGENIYYIVLAKGFKETFPKDIIPLKIQRANYVCCSHLILRFQT